MDANSIHIKNGRVIDPKNGVDEIKDLFAQDGKIVGKLNFPPDITINAEGLWVTPGLIDMHVHLREPGFSHKETIYTGTRSAALGGFTTICCMPNTDPVIDNPVMVEYIKEKASHDAIVNVLPIGSITKGQEGLEMSFIDGMAKAGICAISEDGKTVRDSALLKEAMQCAAIYNLPVLSHCEDTLLAGCGQINEGLKAESLGLTGISCDSEEVIVARDIILAQSSNVNLHICHTSTSGSVRLIEDAKRAGIKVTAEVTPHHITLSDEDIPGHDANYKMNPPLRSPKDVNAVKMALKENIIQVIATDHAPHHENEKKGAFENAANGIVGLETALPICITVLIKSGILTPSELIGKLSSNPARILNIANKKGHLGKNADADITIINPCKKFKIDKNKFASKSRNTPFHGKTAYGSVVHTIVGGEIIVYNGKLL